MATMILISTQTVGAGGAASIDFTSIPQTYTDLMIVISGRTGTTANSEPIGIRPNGATTNLTLRLLEGNGSNASSATATYGYVGAANAASSTSNTFGNSTVYIPNYASSTTNKSISADSVQENNSASANATFQDLSAILWASTAAITSLSFVPNNGGSFVQYSTASLYGITKAATLTAKATGGTITYAADGYVYHTFTSSGTFTPTQTLTANAIIVAGGGGGGEGGQRAGGGGGAGGYIAQTLSLSTIGYSVVVGGGGAVNANGSNSSGFGFTAIGGGKGGAAGANGSSGGSGGGAGEFYTGGGGAGTSGQGNNGGAGNGGYHGAGGGGAGAIGSNNSQPSVGGGAGGAGLAFGASYYAGGGSGGSDFDSGSYPTNPGGIGGGGRGAYGAASATAGSTNSGGGGGGGAGDGGSTNAAAAGGSGVVIVRYLG